MTTHIPDHYRVLGVSVHADSAAIREAYRKLSRTYHPDRHAGSARATECFALISSAWTELSDPGKRLHYDRMLLLRDPLRMVDDPRADRALDVLDLVVRRLRGQAPALPSAARAVDLRVRHSVAFAKAALGGLERVRAEYAVSCGGCKGQGTQMPERNPVCHVCQGVGHVKYGVRRETQECGFCAGRGAVLLAPCSGCAGRGTVGVTREVDVQVPARCRTGTVLRVRGGGDVGSGGGSSGDLLVEIGVEPHPLLTADGDDLVCQVPVGWMQASLGGQVEVPTLEGVERLTLPAGTTSGQELQIAGRGLPGRHGRGKLRVLIQVDVPRDIGQAHADAIAALERFLGFERFAKAAHYRKQIETLRAGGGSPS